MWACFTAPPSASQTAATPIRSKQHLVGELTAAAQRNELAVVQWAADWCAQSRAADELLEEVATDLACSPSTAARVRFLRIDVDEAEDCDMELGLVVLPTVALFEGGRLCQRFTGLDGCRGLRQALQCRGVPAALPNCSPVTPASSWSLHQDAASASDDECSSSRGSSCWSAVSLASCGSSSQRRQRSCWTPAAQAPADSRLYGLGIS